MRTFAASVLTIAVMISAGCGATRKVTNTVAPGPTLTAATIAFVDRDHGKDAGSAVDVWLLRNSDEMAHLHSVGTKFDDHASITPMQLSLVSASRRTPAIASGVVTTGLATTRTGISAASSRHRAMWRAFSSTFSSTSGP